MPVVESTGLRRGGLSCLRSSLAIASVLLTIPCLFCTSLGGGQSGKGQWDV